MKTIKNCNKKEFIIKNSKFITLMFNIQNEKELEAIMANLKSEYKNATHYCYAYIIGNVKRFNDDGEPSGTAGMPILNILEKNELENILCVVIRYFGGTKLGAGGLIRTYSKCVRETLKESTLLNVIKCFIVIFKFKYDDLKKIDQLINNISIINKDFKDDIKYTIKVKELSIIDKLKLCNATIMEIKEDYFIE